MQKITQYFFNTTSKISTTAKEDIIIINYILKFDGCSKGNPGPAGAGAVLYCNDVEIWTTKQFVGEKETNNYAEYCGLLLGLRHAVKKNIRVLKVCGDSQLVVKQMKGEYKIKSENLYPLYNEAKNLEGNFDNIIFEHIYRQHNTKADALANAALEDHQFIEEVKSGFK